MKNLWINGLGWRSHFRGRLQASYSVPLWLGVFMALAMAIAAAGGSYPSPVRAAPSRDPVRWFLDVKNPRTTVCVGEKVEYAATAHYNNIEQETEFSLPGVKIEASSSNESIGKFTKNSAVAGFANEDLVTASFFFEGKKPGKTTLYFEGLIDKKFIDTYISFTVPVTVIPCKFKVVATSHMTQCYPGGCIKFNGVILEGQVTADENGYFTGTAPVVWFSTSKVPGCGAVNSLGTSKVNMSGTMDENGQLMLDLNYEQVTFSDVVKCPMGSGMSNTTIKVSPIKIAVAPGSTGVVVKRGQQLTGGPGGVSGKVDVYVVPVDGTK